MTTTEELKNNIKQAEQLQKSIKQQINNFIEEEYSLLDLVAAEERFNELLEELKETAKNIIDCRQYIELEQLSHF